MAAMVDNSGDASRDVSVAELITNGRNPRGIPTARFIENVEEFLGDKSVEAALGALNELYSKYKFMESSFEKSKNVYKSKLPDLEQTLSLVQMMIKKKQDADEMLVNYSLSDTLFSKAQVDVDSGKCCLWIGANTMVEYDYGEALELIQSQIVQTHAKLQELNEDLSHLRGNSITVEVNMARLFNHSVKLRKLREAASAV